MLGNYFKLTIFLEIKCLDMYAIFMEEFTYNSFAADLLVFRRSFQFTVIYLHHLYMGIKMSLQSVLRLMRAVKMTFTVLTHKRYTSGKERSFKPPSDSMIIKGLCQVQLVPWVHKNIQSTRQLNVSTTCN